jgi:mevalonate kinase
MDVNRITFSAPGKIILFGEHAVVYGFPAIAVAINLRARCSIFKTSKKINCISAPDLFPKEEFYINRNVPASLRALEFLVNHIMKEKEMQENIDIQITSAIPPSAGLGSSAAVLVSLAASLYYSSEKQLNLQKVNDIAFEAEKIIHNTPSGIDNTISTFGGGIRYEKSGMMELPINMEFASIFEEIKNITLEGEKELAKGNVENVGYLMAKNHELLKEIGVSHPKLEEIIEKLKLHGSFGSKLTGAGGGGCIISIFEEQETAKQSIRKFKNQGLQAFITKISVSGVRIE